MLSVNILENIQKKSEWEWYVKCDGEESEGKTYKHIRK